MMNSTKLPNGDLDHRFIVSEHQYDELDFMLKCSNDLQGCTIPLL